MTIYTEKELKDNYNRYYLGEVRDENQPMDYEDWKDWFCETFNVVVD